MTVLASGVLLYRPGGGRRSPTLLLLRNREDGRWGFPKGRREAGDIHELETALREVEEETGYAGLVVHPTFRRTVEYVVAAREDHGKPKRVVYFLARAPAEEPRLSPEHDDYCWADGLVARELLDYAKLRDLAQHALASVIGGLADGHDGPGPGAG